MERVNWNDIELTTERYSKVLNNDLFDLEDALAAARQSAWLAGQPTAFTERLVACALLRTYQKKHLIIELDQPGQGLYFLLKGGVDVWVPRLTGELFPVSLVPPFQWFGEFGAITGKKCLAEYSARTASTVLVIPRSAIAALEAESKDYRDALMDLLSFGIRGLLCMGGDLAGHDPELRVISKLVTFPDCSGDHRDREEHVLPLSQTELAAVSCVSRSTVNLILSKLEKAGIVELGYRRIVVRKRQSLLAALREDS